MKRQRGKRSKYRKRERKRKMGIRKVRLGEVCGSREAQVEREREEVEGRKQGRETVKERRWRRKGRERKDV